MNDQMSQWHTDAVRNALTAKAQPEDEQERPAQTDGVRYSVCTGGEHPHGSPIVGEPRIDLWADEGNCIGSFLWADVPAVETLARRANATESAERLASDLAKMLDDDRDKLAEAVTLLRGCENDWQGQLTDTEANALGDRRRAFIAKVDAP